MKENWFWKSLCTEQFFFSCFTYLVLAMWMSCPMAIPLFTLLSRCKSMLRTWIIVKHCTCFQWSNTRWKWQITNMDLFYVVCQLPMFDIKNETLNGEKEFSLMKIIWGWYVLDGDVWTIYLKLCIFYKFHLSIQSSLHVIAKILNQSSLILLMM